MQSHAASKPNVIIILADDLGYGDVGVYGGKDIPTPHIDQIAKNGVRFTRGYANQPVCAPSRAGLMSGMYQHRFGFENNSGPEKTADPKFGLPLEVPTLAERMKQAGYATGMVGKWHLGFHKEMHPNARGFDEFYGFIGGSRSYNPEKSKDTAPLMRNGQVVTDEKEYLTDAFSREAVDFIKVHSSPSAQGDYGDPAGSDTNTTNSARPYFLYLAFSAVHLPMDAPQNYKERFSHIENGKRRTYAGMLSAMDDAIGRVMETVRESGQEENTLVFFYSDNGGPTAYTTSSNAPLRGEKSDMYEGGIRVPFLMHWKGKVPAGSTYAEPVMGFDCHATALAVAGIERPKELDGKDLLPYVMGEETTAPHAFLCWRWGDRRAITMGDWKMVRNAPDASAELYNLKADISEKNNLADNEPAKLQELLEQYAVWEKGTKPPAWESSPWR